MTKGLAIAGTALVWFPIVAMVLTGVAHSLSVGRLEVDYLMPAEMFPVIVVGAGLLIWATLRAHAYRALVASSVVAMIAMIVAGSVGAELSGLASGETEPVYPVLLVVLVPIALFVGAIVAIGVGGLLLLRDLFGHGHSMGAHATPSG